MLGIASIHFHINKIIKLLKKIKLPKTIQYSILTTPVSPTPLIYISTHSIYCWGGGKITPPPTAYIENLKNWKN